MKVLMLLTLATVLATASVTSHSQTASEEVTPQEAFSQSEEQAQIPKMLYLLIGIHEEYCEKDYSSPKELKDALEQDARLKPLTGYKDVFELMVDEISFAVSAEKDGCTTDVMPNDPKTGEVFFTLAQLTQVLQLAGYIENGGVGPHQKTITHGNALTVLGIDFITPTGDLMKVDYPENGLGRYYTTLFTKKWP